MADLSKVIAGLRVCTSADGGGCDGCPYEGTDNCIDGVMGDALKLLQSIPRTCEECKSWTDRNSVGSPCWECIRKGDEPPSNWRWKYGND